MESPPASYYVCPSCLDDRHDDCDEAADPGTCACASCRAPADDVPEQAKI